MVNRPVISDQIRQQMRIWFCERPAFALMGEFSAGKSTLLNMLLGQTILPARVTATKMPMIWLTHGKDTSFHGYSHDGTATKIDDLTATDTIWDDYLLLRVTLDTPVLERCDIIDTPGISDPRLAAGSLALVGDYIDFAVWCSGANQAWRQSEKAAWTALPAHLRATSILAITRADQISKAGDLKKVLKRANNETKQLFGTLLPISATHAIKACSGTEIIDDQLWANSGAETFLDHLAQAIAIAQQACDSRAIPGPIAEPAPPAPTVTENIDIVSKFNDAASKITPNATNDQVFDTIDLFQGTLLNDTVLDDAHRNVLIRCLSVRSSGERDNSRILKQVEQDIADFAENPWFRLDQTR